MNCSNPRVPVFIQGIPQLPNPLALLCVERGNFEILVFPESYTKIAFYPFRVIYPHRNIIRNKR